MDILTAVANLGFPVGLSIYLLTRFEKQMKGLDDSITGKDGIIDKLDEVRDAVKRNHHPRKK